jgi:hypothetical protein
MAEWSVVKHSDLIGSTISAVILRVDDSHQSSVLTENGYIAPALTVAIDFRFKIRPVHQVEQP